MTTLSVVIICKNQAWNIRRLLESVLREIDELPYCEVIVVDSASTDETVELAARYPIDVVQLTADQPLTAAAGRYVGYMRTSGQLVLFLDGDMELFPGWLRSALDQLGRSERVAVITGVVMDEDPAAAGSAVIPRVAAEHSLRDVKFCGGAGMFRRRVLNEVGTYNPYLCSDEEPELCLRIRRAGYRVVQTTAVIAIHYSPDENAISSLLARWKRNLYIGGGQIIRYHFGKKFAWAYLLERPFVLITGPAVLAGIVSLAALIGVREPRWLLAWGTLMALVVVTNAVLKRSLRRSIASVVKQTLILAGTVRGLLRPPLALDSYPAKLRVVRSSKRSVVA